MSNITVPGAVALVATLSPNVRSVSAVVVPQATLTGAEAVVDSFGIAQGEDTAKEAVLAVAIDTGLNDATAPAAVLVITLVSDNARDRASVVILVAADKDEAATQAILAAAEGFRGVSVDVSVVAYA